MSPKHYHKLEPRVDWADLGHRFLGMLQRESGMLWLEIKNALFPPSCALCGSLQDEASRYAPLCSSCKSNFQRSAATCTRCDASLPKFSATDGGCFHCKTKRWSFSRVIALGEYRGLIRDAVIESKSPRGEALALRLGQLLAQRIQEAQMGPIDFLIPTPQHWLRRITHRANNTELLGEAISRELGIPMRRSCLKRVRATRKQGMLSTAQRKRNVKRAFSVSRFQKVDGASVLIIDDVLTSGSTASEMAKALRRAGAKTIQVAVLARGVGGSVLPG